MVICHVDRRTHIVALLGANRTLFISFSRSLQVSSTWSVRLLGPLYSTQTHAVTSCKVGGQGLYRCSSVLPSIRSRVVLALDVGLVDLLKVKDSATDVIHLSSSLRSHNQSWTQSGRLQVANQTPLVWAKTHDCLRGCSAPNELHYFYPCHVLIQTMAECPSCISSSSFV